MSRCTTTAKVATELSASWNVLGFHFQHESCLVFVNASWSFEENVYSLFCLESSIADSDSGLYLLVALLRWRLRDLWIPGECLLLPRRPPVTFSMNLSHLFSFIREVKCISFLSNATELFKKQTQ